MKRVVIVGAGPAGLFAANELADVAKVTIIEQKNYIGGLGLHSDGKLIFHPKVGGDITRFLSEENSKKLLRKIDDIFKKYGVDEKYKCEQEKLKRMEVVAAKVGIKFIPSDQKHIGSDNLPKVMENFRIDLERKGVEFLLGEKALDLKVKNGKVNKIKTSKREITCDGVILAVGRTGSAWIKKICDKLGIGYRFNPVDIGIRVEVLAEVLDDITSIVWDPKFYIRTKTYDDFVRTFCVCSRGFVTKESYGNALFGVNGHSLHGKKSENTNFALLVTMGLTQPLEDTTIFGELIAHQANVLGGGKPIIQRLGDLRSGKRSTWERIGRSHVNPTLKDVTPGDISLAYPHRIIQDICEALDTLNLVIPGINSDSTLLYAPEIKFYARRIETNNSLQTKISNLFVAGDGAGVSRGIVGAAATGIVAARGVKNLI